MEEAKEIQVNKLHLLPMKITTEDTQIGKMNKGKQTNDNREDNLELEGDKTRGITIEEIIKDEVTKGGIIKKKVFKDANIYKDKIHHKDAMMLKEEGHKDRAVKDSINKEKVSLETPKEVGSKDIETREDSSDDKEVNAETKDEGAHRGMIRSHNNAIKSLIGDRTEDNPPSNSKSRLDSIRTSKYI